MTDLVVLMAVYENVRLEFLMLAVDSILKQTFSNFNFFIMLDGPVSREITEYLDTIHDDRIRLYRFEKNQGLAKALNYMLEIVLKDPTYKFIARMDADDISFPERFEKQRDFLLNNPNISCVGSWYYEINELGEHISEKKLPLNHEELKKHYYWRTPFAHPTVMYCRTLIEKAGFYPTNTILMEDNALWGNALFAGLKFGNIPEFLFKFRKNYSFYNRRSGFKYGLSFVRTRFRINRRLKLPIYSYVLILSVGLIKMVPSFLQKYIYRIAGLF